MFDRGTGGEHDGGLRLSITDLYYDGVRVVQEVGWGGGGTPGAGQQGAGGGGVHGGGAGVPVRPQRNATNGAAIPTAPGLPRRANEMTGPNGTVAWGTCAPGAAENAGGWDWSDRRLEREYVWSADSSAYVDECVAQLVYTNAHEPAAGSSSGQAAYRGDDTSATVLYVLADHNANVVGLTDDRGRLVGQYAYTPYGELRASEYFTPDSGSLASAEAVVAAKGNVLGHQGLRTERFDRPWDGALDAATATAAYGQGSYRALNHNRNRMYDPAAGRFLEQDPNGLGGMVQDQLANRGGALGITSFPPDMLAHFRNGMHTHGAYRASPLQSRDASGLFIDPADIAAAAVMGVVRGLRGGLESVISVYADNMEYDLEWAQDWGSPDDWHTRRDNSWVGEAWDEGVRGGLQDWLNQEVKGLYDPFDLTPNLAMASGRVSRPTAAWNRAARVLNKVGRIAHHLVSFYKVTRQRMKAIEERYGFKFDLHSLENMLPLTKAEHGAGRHRLIYHDKVFARLGEKLQKAGKMGEEAKRVFLAELNRIKIDILRSPDQWFRP